MAIFLQSTILILTVGFCLSVDIEQLGDIRNNPVSLDDVFEIYDNPSLRKANTVRHKESYCDKMQRTCKTFKYLYDSAKEQNFNDRYAKEIKKICAHETTTGYLVDFETQCDIVFRNCISVYAKKFSDAEDIETNGTYYYNGKERPCEFYFNKGKTTRRAIKLYYFDDLQYKSPENM